MNLTPAEKELLLELQLVCQLCQENQKLEACCAEMRHNLTIIQTFKAEAWEREGVNSMSIEHALSIDCGKELIEKLSEMRSLIQETTKFHLREDDHRDWLERRDKALK